MRKELYGHAGFHINPALSLSLSLVTFLHRHDQDCLSCWRSNKKQQGHFLGCMQDACRGKLSWRRRLPICLYNNFFRSLWKRQPAHECWIRPSCAWFATSQGKLGGLCPMHTMSDPCQVWRRKTILRSTRHWAATSVKPCMRWLALCGVCFVNVLLWACGGLLPFTSIQTGSSSDHWLWPTACHSETLPELASNKPSRTWPSWTTMVACANLKLPVFSKEGHDCARGRRYQGWQRGRAATGGISISRWGARLWRRAAISAATASTQRGPMAAAAAASAKAVLISEAGRVTRLWLD